MSFRNLKITTVSLFLIISSAFANSVQNGFFDFKKAKLANETKGITSVILVLKEKSGTTNYKTQASKFKQISKSKFQITNLKPVIPESAMKRTSQLSGGNLSRAAQNMRNMYSAELEKGADIVEVLEKLNSMPEVKYAEPNYPVELFSAPNISNGI